MSIRRAPYPEILADMPPVDPAQPAPGFVGGNTLLVELADETIDRLVAFRQAQPASVVFLRSLGGAYGDVAPQAKPFPAREATWFAMAGAFDGPHLDDAWDPDNIFRRNHNVRPA